MNNTWLLPLTLVLGVVIGAFMGSQMALHAAAPDADQKAKSPTRFKVPDDVVDLVFALDGGRISSVSCQCKTTSPGLLSPANQTLDGALAYSRLV